MPIDPSIPLRAGQGVAPPVNLLTAGSQALGMANQYQNLLTMKAKAAAGQDFQNAIGPDGTLNGATLNQNLANDPAASRAAIESSQAGQSNIGTALQNAGLTQMQAHQRLTFIGDALGAKVVNSQPVTQKDAQNIIGTLVSAHGMTAKEGAQIIGNLASLPDDQLQSTARNLYALAQHGAQQLAPAVSLVNNGPTNVPFQSNVAAGPVGPMAGATGVRNGLSPTTLAGQVAGTDAQGNPTSFNVGQLLHAQGGGFGAGAAAPQQGAPPQAPVQPGVPTQGAPQQPPAQIPGVAPNGMRGAPIGAAPGVIDAATSAAKASTDIYNTAISNISTIPQVRGALQSLNSEIDTANPGPLNDVFTKVGASLSQLGILKGDQATASQLMQKDTMLAVMNQLNGLSGGATDAKMTGFIHATPNGEMTAQSSKAALGMLMGSLDYNQAEASAIQKYAAANGTSKLQDFKVQWTKNNPSTNAYQFQYLPEAERGKYMRSLSPAKQKAFVQSMEQAGTLPTGPGQ